MVMIGQNNDFQIVFLMWFWKTKISDLTIYIIISFEKIDTQSAQIYIKKKKKDK